jgi:pimeloyl-ACP methyl ester carboxylesterase
MKLGPGSRLNARGLAFCGLGVATFAVAVWLVVSWAFAYRLTHRPRPWFAEPAPAVAWGKFEAHRLTSRDGQELGAWLIRGRDDAPSVVLLHGYRGSRTKCLDRAEMLAAWGCTVLLVSLRAHGDSTGDFNDIGYSARHDVAAAVAFLERCRPGKSIVVHGTSMGAAAAVFAAGELAGRVKAYVLECPYKDLKTAVWNRIENLLPPVVDWLAFQGVVLVAPLVLPDWRNIAPAAAIGAIPADVPVLILAGERDRKARPEEARALFDQVRSHATLLTFPGADHLRLHVSDPARYRQAVHAVVSAVERRGPCADPQAGELPSAPARVETPSDRSRYNPRDERSHGDFSPARERRVI